MEFKYSIIYGLVLSILYFIVAFVLAKGLMLVDSSTPTGFMLYLIMELIGGICIIAIVVSFTKIYMEKVKASFFGMIGTLVIWLAIWTAMIFVYGMAFGMSFTFVLASVLDVSTLGSYMAIAFMVMVSFVVFRFIELRARKLRARKLGKKTIKPKIKSGKSPHKARKKK